MNWIQFARLLSSIYRRGGPLPDLDWIQKQGLLAVKLGQIHALRIDFLDREKCEHLAKLYRRNTSLPPEDFASLLERNAVDGFFGQIADMQPTALASASVGQVHRARLVGGDEVIIKAIKSGLRERFIADVKSLKALLNLATRLYPRLARVGDPIGILEDVETYTLSELDLNNELSGYARLAAIRRDWSDQMDLSALKLPKIYPELSNSDVMVAEFVDAPTIDELLERDEFPYERMLDLFRIHGFCMLRVGTFHGDLHPGNALVHDDAFTFIDAGFIGTVGETMRDGLFRFFLALSNYDYSECASALNGMSEVPLEGSRLGKFTADFATLYRDFEGATASEVSLTRKMMQSIRLAVESGMSFERGMFSIIRSLMYMDGMVLRCNPDAVLVRDMRPLLEKFA